MHGMGRPRESNKDMPPGLFESGPPHRRRWYWRPTGESTRAVLQALAPGKRSIPAGATATEARAFWVKRILPSIDLLAPPEDAAGTVNEILNQYVLEVIPTFESESGREGAERYVRTLRKAFGHRTYARTEVEAMRPGARHLTAVDLSQYLFANSKRPVIANHEIRALNKAFILAKTRWGLASYNPAAQASYHQEESRDKYVDDDSYRKIHDKAPPHLQCMMDLAATIGPRKGMILDIRLGDIDWQTMTLTMRPNKQKKTKKKTPKTLPVEITPDIEACLRRALDIRAKTRGGAGTIAALPTAYLFVTRNGTHYAKSSFAKIWKTARDAAGFAAFEITFHDLRAKAGSDSESDEAAQKLLNHADIATTKKVYRRKVERITPLKKVGS